MPVRDRGEESDDQGQEDRPAGVVRQPIRERYSEGHGQHGHWSAAARDEHQGPDGEQAEADRVEWLARRLLLGRQRGDRDLHHTDAEGQGKLAPHGAQQKPRFAGSPPAVPLAATMAG